MTQNRNNKKDSKGVDRDQNKSKGRDDTEMGKDEVKTNKHFGRGDTGMGRE